MRPAKKKSQIGNRNSQILLGAHMSIRGGVSVAIERARSIDCTAMQIFVKNNMQWFARPLSRAEIRAFLDHVQRGELLSVFGHAITLSISLQLICNFTPIPFAR